MTGLQFASINLHLPLTLVLCCTFSGLVNGQEVRTIGEENYRSANSIIWTPDRKKIIKLSKSQIVILDVKTGKQLRVLKPEGNSKLASIDLSHDGNRLLVGCHTRFGKESYGRAQLVVWNLDDDRDPVVISGIRGEIKKAVWFDDKNQVLVITDLTRGICDLDSGKPELKDWDTEIYKRGLQSDDWIFGYKKKTVLLWGHSFNGVTIRNVNTGEIIGKFANGQIWDAKFSADYKKLLTCDETGMITIWDTSTWKAERIIPGLFEGGHQDVKSVAWRPDRKQFAAGSVNGLIKIWNVGLSKFEGHTRAITSLDWTPDGKSIVSGAADGKTIVWNAATGKARLILPDSVDGLVGSVYYRGISPDGKSIVCFGRMVDYDQTQGRNQLLRISIDGQKTTILKERASFRRLEWSPDGKKIALIGKTTQIIDAGSGKDIHSLQGNQIGLRVNWNQDWERLLIDDEREFTLWDTTNWQKIKSFPNQQTIVTLSPNGKWIYIKSKKHRKVLDAENWKPLLSLTNFERPQLSVSFLDWLYDDGVWSTDSKSIALSVNSKVEIWDVDSCEKRCSLDLSDSYRRFAILGFSANGKNILTLGRKSRAPRMPFRNYPQSVITISDANTGAPRKVVNDAFGANLLNARSTTVWSPDGRQVACAQGPYFKVWEVPETGAESSRFENLK